MTNYTSPSIDPNLSGSKLGLPGWDRKFDAIPNVAQIDKVVKGDEDDQKELITINPRMQQMLLTLSEKASFEICDPLSEKYGACVKGTVLAGSRCKPELFAFDSCIQDMKQKTIVLFTRLFLSGALVATSAKNIEQEKLKAIELMRSRAQRLAELDKNDLALFLRAEAHLSEGAVAPSKPPPRAQPPGVSPDNVPVAVAESGGPAGARVFTVNSGWWKRQ
eukprot:TRINITY_DN24492_c0_g1_i1.p1 TRINITY_DN24492_c0_g1~~TRINITY_DN24492_c0_g1_i1.p1  ORF type:complete len:220 (+),score=36.72 TRINITY_DN24492_c0_g1_i1:82-741(+)